MNEYIEFVVRVPIGEADYFIARFGKENVRILGFLLGEEIVRCRGCKYCDDRAAQEWDNTLAELYGDPPCYCDSPQWSGPYLHRLVRPDGYCAWGERREE